MVSLGLSICVVLYESVATTQRFHRELVASLAGCTDYELLYYDNSPGDELASWFAAPAQSGHRYWHDKRNKGFAYANNQLILRARYERVLLLNPDVFGFEPDFWPRLLATAVPGEVMFVRLLNADGSFQDCVGDTVGLLRAVRRRPDYAALTQPTAVGMGIMAFMLTDKSTYGRVGLLDCDYALYAEDMDWCHRATRAGCRVVFHPGFTLTHLGGASAADRWSRGAALRRKYAAERLFIDKHFRGTHRFAMQLLNRLKVALRARS